MSDAPPRLATALADRYRIERELGQGGMATVYLAHDVRHDRKVALKVLRPELAAVIGADRFLAEIRTTANLQHPHILPLFDSGAVDGLVFYVMPFVEGETLRDRLNREKQLPIADGVRIASEVAGALDYAHRRGVIHRDIKPENVLLHDGSALVADFGIALAASRAGDTRMTETGMSLGTPYYMSPEQALGERDLTARSDVYALGCVTYEMLLGEPPFTGPTAQSILAKLMSEKPAPMRPRRERIPPEVEEAVLTALEKLPADRFASAAEFAAGLSTAPRSRTSQQAQPAPPRAARGLDWRVAGVAGLLVGAIAAIATAPAFPRARADGALSGAARVQLTFNGRSWRPAISPDGEYVAYVDQVCPRSEYNPCTSSLFVQGRGSDRPVAILSDAPWVDAPRFSHDGLSLVVAAALDSVRDGVFVLPRLGGVPRRIGPGGLFDTHATADSVLLVTPDSPDAPAVARVIALESGVVADSVVLGTTDVDGVAWSPDGRLLALVDDYTSLRIVRRDGTIADSVGAPFRPVVRWTPDGTGVLLFRALPVKEDDLLRFTVGRDGAIEDGPEVVLPVTQTLLRGDFDIARQTGQMVLASGSATWDLWTFELDSAAGGARQRTSGTTWYGIPSISADGSRLFYIRGDATGDNLYMMRLPDEEEALTAEPYPGTMSARAVSPDGSRVLFGHATPSGYRLGDLDLASRQATYIEANDVESPMITESGIVFSTIGDRGLGLIQRGGARASLLTLPDSLELDGYVVNPTGDSAAVIVDGDPQRLAITALREWQPRWILDFPPDQDIDQLSWNRAGWIFFWLWLAGEDAPSLWQTRSSGGAPTRRITLPRACNIAEFDVALDAERGACRSEDTRSDVWLLGLPGGVR